MKLSQRFKMIDCKIPVPLKIHPKSCLLGFFKENVFSYLLLLVMILLVFALFTAWINYKVLQEGYALSDLVIEVVNK